jgi:MYXO-CTERM domain-containing protein
MAHSLLRGGFLAAATVLAFSSVASAHFVLKAPDNWMTQDDSGNPQKTGPCGAMTEMNQTYTPSNAVTTFKEGQMVAITIDETVTHPGHYRVALAMDHDSLPAEPALTPTTGMCGTAAVMDPPVMPILADGVLDHTNAFTEPQTIMVKLPDGFTCEKCTLQVLEFMSQHPMPCFYHHCADITITPNDGGAGMSAGGAAGGGAPNGGAPSAGAGGSTTLGGAGGMSAGGASSGAMGGMTGQAGSSIAPAAGSPGMSSGGTGNTGTGGAPTGSGGTTATGGTGNTSTGTGGTSVSQAGNGTAGSSKPANNDSTDEGGCSTAHGRTSSPFALVSLLALAGLRARRRRT